MNWFDPIRAFLKTSLYHVQGSTVKVMAENVTYLPTTARFEQSQALLDRIEKARSKLPENNVKRLIEDQEDTFVSPKDDPPVD